MGLEEIPTLEKFQEIVGQYDSSYFHFDAGQIKRIIFLKFDAYDVAWIHIWIDRSSRNFRDVADTIIYGAELAKQEGMRKLMAPLLLGNPLLKPGKKKKFGFELEGVLKKHAVIGKKEIDVFLYSRFLV